MIQRRLSSIRMIVPAAAHGHLLETVLMSATKLIYISQNERPSCENVAPIGFVTVGELV